MAALGTGSFPTVAFGPPHLRQRTNAAVNAFNTLDSHTAGELFDSVPDITIPGDYAASGVGLRGQTGGSIAISTVPAGATVAKALLYWGMLDNGEDASLKQMLFNGTAITGTRIGMGLDTGWGVPTALHTALTLRRSSREMVHTCSPE